MSLETIAVRAYTEPKSPKSGQIRPFFGHKKSFFDRTITINCKATSGFSQNLWVGYFEIHQHNVLEEFGLFFEPNTIKKKELDTLLDYTNKYHFKLYPLQIFRKIFLYETYDLQTLCLGFDLPFLLTRIAMHTGIARKDKKDCFSLLFSKNLHYPRLQLTHATSILSFIQWANTFHKSKNFRGNFLDLRVLSNTLTDKKHTLQSACKSFDVSYQKIQGKKFDSLIQQCLHDVKSITQLYKNTKTEYDSYKLDLPITRAYTPASIAKSIFNQINIKSFLEQNKDFSKELSGYCAASYFGGRTECKIRKTPTLVDELDFRSMYPTVSVLQNLWRDSIAEKIQHKDTIQETIRFVDSIKLKDISNPEIWTKLQTIVLVEPDGDALPIRSQFGQKYAWNIGVCEASGKIILSYTMADIVFSKLVMGKTPKIIKAFSFYPVGVQQGLKPIEIHGIKFDPYSQDLFKELVEHRQKLKDTRDTFSQDNPKYAYYDRLQNVIKIITNAVSYGIFFEIGTATESKPVELDVYGLTHFSQKKRTMETPKQFFNPVVAPFITSASRLLLGSTEIILKNHGATHAYCDTDSMFVPPRYTKEIQEFFQPLNPYSFDLPLFKLERSKWFYGISTKRYCLFEFGKDGEIVIDDEKFSGHGLGHLLNPFGKSNEDWYKIVWQDIVELHYGTLTWDEFYEKYENKYAIQKLIISSPDTLRIISKFNEGKEYHKQIKPYNQVLLGFSNRIDDSTGKQIKPFAPYCEPKIAVFDSFVDFNNKNNKLCGSEYWKPFSDVVFDYLREPESKLEGDTGILKRKKITIDKVIHIGKESNNLEYADSFGLYSDSYATYENYEEIERKFRSLIPRILKLQPKHVKTLGISRQTLWNIKKKIMDNQSHGVSKILKQKIININCSSPC